MPAVHGTSLDIPASDGVADAYLTHPDDGTAHPGVLFFTDDPGLRPRIREMATSTGGSVPSAGGSWSGEQDTPVNRDRDAGDVRGCVAGEKYQRAVSR